MTMKTNTSSTTTAAATAAKIPSPYKLLDYYGYEDAGIFFGREAECRQMVGEILSSRLLVLYSPSGSGKTSLIRAGVSPQLEEMGYRTVYTRMEAEPVPSVIRAVADALNLPAGAGEETRDLYGFLKQVVPAPENHETDQKLLEVQEPFLEKVPGRRRHLNLVIFLDQFEEFFIVYRNRPELRREFIQQVARIKYDDRLPVFLVLSMREDYLAHLHEFRSAIPSIFQNNANIRLESFDEKAGRRAMEKPLEAIGWRLAPALADTLVKDLNKEGIGIEPIKLQMVCGALWEQRSTEPGEIPLSAYEAMGGAETIIRRFIAGRLEKVPRRRRRLLVKVCEALKTPDNTKRYRSVEDLRTQLNIKKTRRLDAILKPLVDLQVLREEERGGTQWYEFKHDYVAAELSRWIQDRKEKIRRRRLWYAGLPGIALFLALFIYLFISYNTFYAGFSIPASEIQEEEIIISRGVDIFGQPISTGLFKNDVRGQDEINKVRSKFKISFWDRDNWLALADTLNFTEGGKFLYYIGQKQLGIKRLIRAISDKASIYLERLGKSDSQVIDFLSQILKDDNIYVRLQAADTLSRLGKADQDVIDVLIKALNGESPYVQIKAANALCCLGKADQKVIVALLLATKDINYYVREQAAATLGQLGKTDQNVIASLLLALKDNDDKVREQASAALGLIGKADQNVISALLQALKDENGNVRSKAAEALGGLRKDDQIIIAALLKAIKDENFRVRYQAAATLGKLGKGSPEIIAVLIQALKDDNNSVRSQSAAALGNLGKAEPKVIDALLHALKSDNEYGRRQAADSLGLLGKEDDNAIIALIQALEDKDFDVRYQATAVLGRSGKAKSKVINALLKLLENENPFIRLQAAAALVSLGKVDNKVIFILLQALKDEEFPVREQAAKALESLGKAGLTVIDDLLQALKEDNEYVRFQVAIALGRLGKGDKKVIDTLLQALKDENDWVRQEAAAALGNLGKAEPKVMGALLQAMKDQSFSVREKAGKVLGRLWQNKSEEELINMLEDTRSEIRTAAAHALASKKSLSPGTINEINRRKDSSPHPWVRLGAWKTFELLEDKKEKIGER